MTKPPEPVVTGELKVTQADRDFHMWLTGTPLDEQDDETKQKVISHRLTPRQDEVREGFQVEVGRWMLACFGEEIAADRIERADRFIEEALELAQTVPGFTVERARALVEYVFARPVGEMGQEVGGVGVTLAALCNTYAIDIAAEWERELARVWTKVDAIRAKQASKPVGFALPAAPSDSSTREESGAECPTSPFGTHQIDTTMEEGPHHCFNCGANMRAALSPADGGEHG